MQLKRSTDILLRILIHLASRPQDQLISIQEMSEALDWNKNLVIKVSHFAVQHGLLKAVRGRNGGVALAKPACEYRIGDLVRLMEGEDECINCDEPHCPLLTGGCRLRGMLYAARESFYRKLNAATLADVVSSVQPKTA